MDISKKIKQLRQSKKISQKELASTIGVTQATITKIESGITKNTSVDIAIKIAVALDTSVYELFGDDGFINKTEEQNKFANENKELKIKLSEKEQLIKALTNEKRLIGKTILDDLFYYSKIIYGIYSFTLRDSTDENEKELFRTLKENWHLIFERKLSFYEKSGYFEDKDIKIVFEETKETLDNFFNSTVTEKELSDNMSHLLNKMKATKKL